MTVAAVELDLRQRYVRRMLAFRAEGIHETPDGSNRTRLGAHYGWNGVAWCCITCCEAFLEEFGFYLFKTAGVAQAIGWAKAGTYGLRWIPRERAGEATAGDLGTYDSGRLTKPGNPSNFHINMVTDRATITNGPGGYFWGTGGNESNAVRTQQRDGKYLQGFIVLPWVEIAKRLGITQPPAPAPTTDVLEDDMALVIRTDKEGKRVALLQGGLLYGLDESDLKNPKNEGGQALRLVADGKAAELWVEESTWNAMDAASKRLQGLKADG